MSTIRGSVHAKWIIGKVIGTKMRETAKVRVTRLVLDPFVLKFYNKRKTYYAYDPQKRCTEGDIVLLKALPERKSKKLTHDIAEIVYKVGRVVDPITGKLCAGTRFLESVTDSENLTEKDTSYLSEKIQELTVSSQDK
ncbi:hypothetical protein JRQ81_008263 [Phrynocephalus forsythii]|uniref:Small ribosomal subunit protein uS17m n=1 Tax=Phrynocephalus forsythii TaxID=171643 RepID=A0A9Q1ASQ8_9SAUR|nr:hypothetical protein JRQ81_008263 [Phrynocephalus forsythii]